MALTIKDLNICTTLDQAEATTVVGGISLTSLPWQSFASRTVGVTRDTELARRLREKLLVIPGPRPIPYPTYRR